MPSSSKLSKYGIISWGLYDWANSAFPTVITTFIFATYFIQGIAQNPILGTSQWANATALAGLVIALLAPILGAAADYVGKRKPWIAFFTLTTLISSTLLWFAKPSPTYVNWALTWVVIGTISFELTLVFYNSMMRELVGENYLGRLSGWAWGIGYIGGLACLVVALMFVRSSIPVLHLNTNTAEHIRISGPLVAIWFGLFSLPFFIFTPDRQSSNVSLISAIQLGLNSLVNTFKNLRSSRELLLFLLAHMIYIDGLNTLFAFGGIYAAGTFHLTPEKIILFGIAINVTAGIGAIGFGWVDDYLGPKTTILISLSCLIICGISLLSVYSLTGFWILAILLGLFVGPVQAASRSLMAHIAPPKHTTELFGLYSLSGKITAFAGPWILGMMTAHFSSQRIGMSTVILFLIVGALLLYCVKIQK